MNGEQRFRSSKRNPKRLRLNQFSNFEVEETLSQYASQLYLSFPSRLTTDHFCTLYLRSGMEKLPRRIFGRIDNIFPAHIDHFGQIEMIELLVPRIHHAPALVTIHGSEIDFDQLSETYSIKVPLFATTEDLSDFEGYEEDASRRGFVLLPTPDPELLLNSIFDRSDLPLFIVVSSRWLSTLLPELYASVVSALKLLLISGTFIVNYHPVGETLILNRVLGRRPMLDSQIFYDAYETEDVVNGLDAGFEKMFMNIEPNDDEEGSRNSRGDVPDTIDDLPLFSLEKPDNKIDLALSSLFGVSIVSNRRLKIFICHSSQDKLLVRQLYKRLASEKNLDIFFDERSILPGQDWDMEIRKAVRQSHVVIVCLSHNSITREGYVQREIRMALDIAEEKLEESIFIIPLKLQQCIVPGRLSQWQWLDYFGEDAYEKLMKSLQRRASDLGINLD
ncbi:MAG TPA: toll/interleukin-1 receptor domain-containing protein [Anaerolineales bacterium]|nr:toll/interleukin-1 receptor domain-containing protein [Anaerolineales bacterium]